MKLLQLLILVLLGLSGCAEPDRPTIGLYLAVHRGDIDQLERHIYWGADINQIDVNGETPLHVAARKGEYIVAKVLVKNGAKLDIEDGAGHTPIYNAIITGRTQLAELLIQAGAALDANQLLFQVARQGVTDRDVIELLKQNGADINRVNERGETPLITAIKGDSRVLVKFLIAAGADVNQPGGDGSTPLNMALEREDPDIIRLLERNGAIRTISQ